MEAARRWLVVMMLVGCTKHEEQAASSVAATQVETLPPNAADATPGPVTACTAAFSCGLSHPGLGSSSRTTSVDLGKCERSYVAESGPYDPTSPRNPTKPTVTKVAPNDCNRLRDLVSMLGPADAKAAMESAHMDTEACGLTVTCTGEAAARFNVQRQTTTGATRVEQTIRAVLGGS